MLAVDCVVLRRVFTAVYGPVDGRESWNMETLALQTPLDGLVLKRLASSIHAVWRCRCVLVQGHAHSGKSDLIIIHFILLIDDLLAMLHTPHALSDDERVPSRL